jgi:hypothetical protein
MIRVEGPDPTAMIARARHHLQIVVPLLEEAALCLVLKCPLSRDHHEHVLSQRRRGGESYGLYLADGREFHFRLRHGPAGGIPWVICVYDRYKMGDLPPIAVLSSREDIRKFFSNLRVDEAAMASQSANGAAVRKVARTAGNHAVAAAP